MGETSSTPTLERDRKPQRLSVADARARILTELTPMSEVESVALRTALGRVLARDALSTMNVPPHANSAVDGYALASADLPREGEAEFRVIASAEAGRPYLGSVARGQTVRIMTGAAMPAGTDSVVMQEDVRTRDDVVLIGAGHVGGQHVRAAGEDIAQGEIALAAGKRLLPAELGLLASLGFAAVPVYRRPRVAFFSTGDELRSIDEPLGAGQIYDSNRYTLFGMLSRAGVELKELGVVRDERSAVRQALALAAADADVVISSGGVSVGDADHIKETLESLGQVSFWQIAMRPGRPLAFGHVGRAAFFGLPGNPVAAMVTFYQFVQPALQRMMGEPNPPLPPTFRARSLSRLKTRIGRTEFIRGILERDSSGEWVVRSTGGQGSGILRSMSMANCFIVLPPESGDAEPGALVDVQPFHGLV